MLDYECDRDVGECDWPFPIYERIYQGKDTHEKNRNVY